MLAALTTAIVHASQPASAEDRPSDSIVAAERDVLDEVNQFRGAQGLKPLRMASAVRSVARDRVGSMKRFEYFGHASPTGQDAGDLLRSRDIGRRPWGEVIGRTWGQGVGPGSRWMVDWWKRSPVHRGLLLNRRFDAAGVGVVRDGGRTLWTIVLVE
jgi:uncharacterized protein YkwD